MTNGFVTLPGSHRGHKPATRRLGGIAQDATLELTIALRGPSLPKADEIGLKPMSRDEVEAVLPASADDADKVVKVLEGFGFRILDVSLPTRSIRVAGTVACAEAAFKANLAFYHDDAQGTFRGREGELCLPADLDGIVTGVFGLDERRVARRKTAATGTTATGTAATGTAAGTTSAGDLAGPVTPADIERHYNFPPGDGAGQRIAIAEFGGGYFDEDLTEFCARNGRSKPTVQTVPLGAPALTLDQILALPPHERDSQLEDSGEVMMDVEIVAGLCPAADILVYFAPFTQKGWVDLLDAIIKDAADGTPLTVSISWGYPEDVADGLSAAAIQAIGQKFQTLAMMGVTVCVAAGDDGSGDNVEDDRAHVNFPASSPFVLSVGGTMAARRSSGGPAPAGGSPKAMAVRRAAASARFSRGRHGRRCRSPR